MNNYLDRGIDDTPEQAGLPVSIKRIFARAVRFWYLITLSVITALVIAFLINRYSNRIYPVTASIIVREGTENAAAEFLYKSNPLVNPYRNFYNELYIMRSYPLLQEVVEELNFSIKWYREGSVKTTEFYESDFPVRLRLIPDQGATYGQHARFKLIDDSHYALEYFTDREAGAIKNFEKARLGDTLDLGDHRLVAFRTGPVKVEKIGKIFDLQFEDPYEIAKDYANRLKATWAEQGASVVNLEITGPLPEKEIDFVNQFIDRYQQYDVDKKNEVASKSIEFLDRQLDNIGDSLDYFDNKIEDFKETQFLSDFELETERIFTRLKDLEAQRAQLTLYDNYFKYLEEYINSGDEFDQIVPPSAVGITDLLLTQLIEQLTAIQFNLRMLGDLQNENNPMVVERRQRIVQLKRDILEGVNSIKATQKINRDFLSKQIADAERELSRLPQSERKLIDLRRNYTIRENLYLFLMQKRAEAGISRASTTSDIIVVNPPSQKGGAISPKPMLNYAIALVASILIPFIIFFLLEFYDDKIQSKEDIESLTTIPIIGGVGHNSSDGNLVVVNSPKSFMAECFRTLRSSLNFFIDSKDKKIIMITSSVSGEGKTFTTINLASILAFSGKRVLIVGADMRRPKLFTDFNLRNDVGLSSYLSSMNSLEEVIQHTGIENLDLISGGPVPPNPSELLLLPVMKQMLAELLKQYDYVLLDTPPIGLVSDALNLVPMVDHTIFMIRQGYTPRFFIKELQALTERRDIRQISILFNDIRKTGPGYGYGYGYGYSYGYDNYGYGYNRRKDGNYYQE